MIQLGQEAALLVIGIAVTVVAAWGSSVSIRSAARGPRWALDHLASVRPWVVGGVLIGLVLAAAVRPLWVGLVVLYVALTVVFLAAMLRRALVRLEEAGGLDDLPIERRREIVARARRTIGIAGVVIGAIGVGGSLAGAGPVGWIPALLGLTLVVTAVSLSAEARPSN
ncbi:MAG TPA: hypothetical protein VLB67_12600 [Acidimicrobiia bacterium]|nr:hypothetical protein [Acidimicrobiia bacterium]